MHFLALLALGVAIWGIFLAERDARIDREWRAPRHWR